MRLNANPQVQPIGQGGLLTRLFTRSYHPDNDYHLVWDPDSPRLTRIRCVTDWLKEAVAQGPGCQPDIQAEP